MILTRQTLSPKASAIFSAKPGSGAQTFQSPRLRSSPRKFSLKYTFDVFNLTNTASFDIPIDDVSQNINFNGFPVVGQPSTTTPCNSDFNVPTIYVCPTTSGLGITNKTIGSPRQIQMSLRLTF